MGNLSLGMQFRTCEKFWESADSGLALSQNFSQIQKPHRNYFDCDSQRESPTKKTQIAESTTFCYSKSYFCHSEQSEESKRNPSLRDFATQNRGNPPCKKTQDLQRGLPRRFCESARNDEFIRDSSLRFLSAQNDKIGAENDNLSGFAESALDSALFYNKFFPIKFAESRGQFLPNTALIALGANLKNPIVTFKSLFTKLARNAKIHILSTSPIYKNPPFGYANQPFFYNATILLATKMCLLEFYAFIFYLERIFGRNRKRAFKNAPRALDIDIIFFNDIFMRSKKLNIPHPSWQTRASVLVPLIFQVHYKGF